MLVAKKIAMTKMSTFLSKIQIINLKYRCLFVFESTCYTNKEKSDYLREFKFLSFLKPLLI